MVPSTTRSQLAAFSLVTWALKSWSVGLWVTVSTILRFIFSACACTPSSTSLPKSVSWYIAQPLFLGVVEDRADLAAGDAARLVGLVEAHLHRVRGGDPVGGGGAGEVGVHAEHDLGLGDPAGLLLGRGHAGQGHRGRHHAD